MATYRIKAPDGSEWDINAPDTASEAEVMRYAQSQWKPKVAQPSPRAERAAKNREELIDLAQGAASGIADVGDTLLNVATFLPGKVMPGVKRWNDARGAALDAFNKENDSAAFSAGRIGTNIAATIPVGGALSRLLAGAPKLAPLAEAVRTGGMKAGGAGMGTRIAGGATTGGVSTALVSPEDADTGAVVGGALPPGLKALGTVGGSMSKALRGGGVSPEVQALATRAKELGINIPADRLVDSRPMNAVASGLNYIPFSGRAATEARLEKELTRATSRLVGQDSDNMTKALRDASADLGGKFERTLKENTVTFDDKLLDDLASIQDAAQKELGADGLKAITNQIDELFDKGASGAIDGQAAYNIKRTLDRIGRRNTPEAFHAIEMKKALMEALDRSFGPEKAAEFAKTRQQYGNMLALEKLAKNGAEGDISVARLANMRNINNESLQEIADIASQFVKAREPMHGAWQRGAAGIGLSLTSGPLALAGLGVGGRLANMMLNSNAARNYMTGTPGGSSRLSQILTPVLPRAVPLLESDR